MDAINEASGKGNTRVAISNAFDAETAQIISAVFREKQTYVLSKLRDWCRIRLKCNIEENSGEIYLTWDDTTLFATESDGGEH
jgi:hypothetical protein